MPTIEVSDQAFDFLKSRAEPFVNTTVTVVDRLITELLGMPAPHAAPSLSSHDGQAEMRFGTKDFPSVKFTTITTAKVAGKPVSQKHWNSILEDMIAACVDTGNSAASVRAATVANTADGRKSDNGYRFVPAAGFSFQGLEANRACRSIARLAEAFAVPVDITFRWQENDQVEHPNKVARLVMP